MNPVSVIIVDDEAPARELIKHYLHGYPEVQLIGEANNGFEALKIMKENSPQLVFLDIQMPKLTGFEMVDLIDNPPAIIFSTAYDRYAIRAFELNAIDYLLKPYTKERFDVAIQKAFSKIESGSSDKSKLHSLHETIAQHDELVRIAVKDRQQIHIVPVNDINFIEADGDYVKLHTEQGSFLKEKTMKYFEANLSSLQFIRIHRSYIVNVDQVAKIELYEKENYRVHLKNGTVLKAGVNGYKALKNAVRL
jgi:two-component system LytT family response regulator